MDSLIAQIQNLADKADEKARNDILITLRDLQFRLETPIDTYIRLYNAHCQVAVTYVGAELGLFQSLAQHTGTLSVKDLAEKSGASYELLERILRYLASTGLMENTEPDRFQANKATHVFADPVAKSGLYHAFDTCSPAIQAYPSFLAENKYQDSTDTKNTAFQKGHNTKLGAFEWLSQQPKLFGALQQVMTTMQSSDWLRELPVLDRATQDETLHPSENAFLVDVGGGHGHQCVQVLEKHPTLKGRLVLQDLPQAVDKLAAIDGVQVMAQDFFEKQKVQGAKFYYLRRILHDWPDALSIKILQNLSAAMNQNSRILIDEVVLPDFNVHWHAAMADMTMGILFAGKERTRKQWDSLVEKSGLRLIEVQTYNVSLYNSVIVLGLK